VLRLAKHKFWAACLGEAEGETGELGATSLYAMPLCQ
jgi:hypothetical protein